jgi:phenylacetate-coenzyme A ligase PaaK-like adenylate-forming protein
MWHALRLATKAIRQRAVLRKAPEQIAALQGRRLRALVARAKADSPFYAERFRGVDPERFELAQLPPLTKAEMMADFDRVPTDRRLKRREIEAFMGDPGRLGRWYLDRYAPSRTSGTQGMPALIVQDRAMMELLFALQMGRGSVFPANPVAAVQRLVRRARLAVVTIGRGFYPSAVALAYAPRAAEAFVNRLWLTHIEPLEQVVAQLNAFGPEHPAGLRQRPGGVGARGPGRPAPPGPGRAAAAGHQHERAALGRGGPARPGRLRPAGDEQLRQRRVHGPLHRLPQGHGMHQQADWAVLEVVDRDNRPVPPGQPGEKVLITNLYNTLQPFIRYELADVVTMSPTPCPCGSPLPLVLKVEGRTDEMVWIRDADRFRQVHPYVFVDFLDEYPALGWYQIVQEERNRFVLRAAPAPGRQIGLEELRGIIRRGLERFGLAELIRFDVEIAADVAPDPLSGKLKRITSRIGPPENPPPRANGVPAPHRIGAVATTA